MVVARFAANFLPASNMHLSRHLKATPLSVEVRTLALALMFAVLAVSSQPSTVAAREEATAFQLNPAHDGHISFAAGFAPPLRQAWIRKFPNQISYPVIANGIVFVTQGFRQDATLVALDLGTGETIWEKLIGKGSGIAYDNGKLFDICNTGLLQAFSANRRGALKWSVLLPDEYGAGLDPLAFNGQVFLTGSSVSQSGGRIFAVDQRTGAVNWTTHFDIPIALATLGDGGLYVTPTGLYGKFAFDTGKVIWGLNRDIVGAPYTSVYYRNRLYVRDKANGNVILDSKTGTILGGFDTDQTPAFWRDASGEDYEFVLRGGDLVAVDAATQNVLWTFAGDGQFSGPPIVINDVVAAGSLSGILYIVDAATGKRLWHTNLGAPIVGGDDVGVPFSGLGAGQGTLVVPATNRIAAYVVDK